MVEVTDKSFELSVVTPEGPVFDGLASMIVVPGAAGEIGILPRHAPLVAMLKAGETRVRTGDAWTAFAATGDPTTPSLGPWPRYEPATRSTMLLDTACSVVDDPHGDERRAWRR